MKRYATLALILLLGSTNAQISSFDHLCYLSGDSSGHSTWCGNNNPTDLMILQNPQAVQQGLQNTVEYHRQMVLNSLTYKNNPPPLPVPGPVWAPPEPPLTPPPPPPGMPQPMLDPIPPSPPLINPASAVPLPAPLQPTPFPPTPNVLQPNSVSSGDSSQGAPELVPLSNPAVPSAPVYPPQQPPIYLPQQALMSSPQSSGIEQPPPNPSPVQQPQSEAPIQPPQTFQRTDAPATNVAYAVPQNVVATVPAPATAIGNSPYGFQPAAPIFNLGAPAVTAAPVGVQVQPIYSQPYQQQNSQPNPTPYQPQPKMLDTPNPEIGEIQRAQTLLAMAPDALLPNHSVVVNPQLTILPTDVVKPANSQNRASVMRTDNVATTSVDELNLPQKKWKLLNIKKLDNPNVENSKHYYYLSQIS